MPEIAQTSENIKTHLPVLWGRILMVLGFACVLPIVVHFYSAQVLSDFHFVSEPFHSLVEVAGGCAAIILAFLFISFGLQGRNNYYIWISFGLLGMGSLDIFHAGIAPGNAFVWLHSLAVFVGGLFFLWVWTPSRFKGIEQLFIYAFVVFIVIVGTLSIVFPQFVPQMVVDGHFTIGADFLNIIGGIFFILAGIYFIVQYLDNKKGENLLFVNLCMLFGTAGILFEMSALWDFSWWFWHLLRLIAYLVIIGFVFYLVKESNTESKNTQKELEQIFQISMDGKLIIDMDYNILRANQTLLDMLQKDKSDIIGKKCFDLMQVTLCKTDNCPIAQIRAGKEMVEQDVELNRPDGSALVIRFVASKFDSSAGDIMGIIESFFDVTSQKQAEEKISKQNLLNEGQTRLYEAMQGALDLEKLTHNMIRFICKHVKAKQGALYIYDDGQDVLLLNAGYAIQKSSEKTVLMGAGTVGQAARDKKMISLNDIPKNAMVIGSSLGKSRPRHIVTVPLVTDGNLMGVIELGTFDPFTDIQIQFLKQSSENMAIGIRTAQMREQMKALVSDRIIQPAKADKNQRGVS